MKKENNNQRVTIQASTYNNGELKRICPHCKKEKPLSEFGLRAMEPGGTVRNQSWCKECRSKG